MENLKGGQWEKKKVEVGPFDRELTPDEMRAVRDVYDKLADRGLVWLDGHHGNIFFFEDAGGRLRAGITDQDLIFPAKDFHKQSQSVHAKAGTFFGTEAMAPVAEALTKPGAVQAKALMDAFFKVRFEAVPGARHRSRNLRTLHIACRPMIHHMPVLLHLARHEVLLAQEH
jgi:hypothetical protein